MQLCCRKCAYGMSRVLLNYKASLHARVAMTIDNRHITMTIVISLDRNHAVRGPEHGPPI